MISQVQIPVETKTLDNFFSSVQALVDKVTWYSDGGRWHVSRGISRVGAN